MTLNHPTGDPASKTASAAIKSCYRSDVPSYAPCDETTTVTAVVEQGSTLPAFVAWDSVNTPNVIDINPTDNAQSRAYTMSVSYSIVDSTPITYSVVDFTVSDCIITHFDLPTNPGP